MLFPTQEEIDRWRLAVADEELFGKNDAVFELRLPSELKDALARKGAEQGQSAAAVLRLAAVIHIFGIEHVGMLIARRYGVALATAPEVARTTEAV